jgi:hypothetical protein
MFERLGVSRRIDAAADVDGWSTEPVGIVQYCLSQGAAPPTFSRVHCLAVGLDIELTWMGREAVTGAAPPRASSPRTLASSLLARHGRTRRCDARLGGGIPGGSANGGSADRQHCRHGYRRGRRTGSLPGSRRTRVVGSARQFRQGARTAGHGGPLGGTFDCAGVVGHRLECPAEPQDPTARRCDRQRRHRGLAGRSGRVGAG